jgi:hypothetical protein
MTTHQMVLMAYSIGGSDFGSRNEVAMVTDTQGYCVSTAAASSAMGRRV